MKRFFALLMASLMIVSLVSCKKPVNDESDVKEEIVADETAPKEEKEEIVLDIKELDEVDELTLKEAATALGFENEKLFHAVANAMGKTPFELTQQDIDNVHYIAVGPEETGHSVYIGYIDYVDLCFSEESGMEDIMSKLNDIVMMSVFEYDKETDTLSNLGNFKNVEMFEIYDVEIEDVSFIKNYPILALGYFKNNGITDVSSLSDFNPETLIELDFTGNDIDDWSALYHIKEKVTVFYGVADGMPMTISLESMLKQQANKTETAETDETEVEEPISEQESANEQETVEFVDENGEAVDFSSLFE